jgi:glucose/arabinose dehydrogenase
VSSLRSLMITTVALSVFACNGSDAAGPGDGGTTLPPGLTLKLNPFISTGLSGPVFLTQPVNDGRIFIVEQSGRIRIVRDGVLQTAPFLDITTKVLSGGERGLLSVAFHPHYSTNHFLYVYYTSQPSGDVTIARFTATSADVADPNSLKIILTVAHSQQANHNGGLVSFGPDGKLYAGLGDGGGGGDPFGNGQNFNALLGSLIRVDVDNGDPYSIPTDNPFAGQTGKRGEIWAKGLRNPWRYTFDATTGLLYIADVGQNLHEEIDVSPANTGGVNYGWNIMEGFSCYNATTCTQTGLQLPLLDYSHSEGCSITGGYVYRGSDIPEIRGHYFYSDYCTGFLRSVRYLDGAAVDKKDWGITNSSVASFGLDFAGELYMLAGNSVLKLAKGS